MSKSKEIAEAKIALTIAADKLDVDQITAKLKLEPTRVIHKGDVVGRIPAPLLAGQDQWICARELKEVYDTDSTLNDLLIHIQNVKEEVQAILEYATVTLQLYVKSDYAHMSYVLTPETLAHLVATGIPLEISSFSWGGL